MGFFNKLLGRKKNKGDEEPEVEPQAKATPEPAPEPVKKPKPKPKPKAKAKAKAKAKPAPEPEPEVKPEPESKAEATPEPASPTESMSEISSSSGRGVVKEASGTIGNASSGASLRSMSSGSLRASPNMIQCNSCERDLPVPLASGVTVTCPFCLGRTAHKP